MTPDATTAVVWAFDGSATLYAWDADSLALLWNSADLPSDVAPCSAITFAMPTVLDNMVYVGCDGKVMGYGTRAASRTVGSANFGASPGASSLLDTGRK